MATALFKTPKPEDLFAPSYGLAAPIPSPALAPSYNSLKPIVNPAAKMPLQPQHTFGVPALVRPKGQLKPAKAATVAPPTTSPGTTPQSNTTDPVAFIRQWQASHPASEGIGPLAAALQAAGFNVPRFMYGTTPSNNELVINGQKYKVLGGEDNPESAFWYFGADEGGGGSPAAGPAGANPGLLAGLSFNQGGASSAGGGGSGGGGSIAAPTTPGSPFGMTPSYTPTEIGASPAEAMTFEQILQAFGLTPDSGINGGAIEGQTGEAVQRLLANPSSLDERTVAEMKGRERENLAVQQKQDDEALQGMGAKFNITDSPWLASERLASRRGRDEAINASNRNLDISAAQTRKSDEINAITTGASYAQRTADNLYRNQQERITAVSLASDTALKAAASSRDRQALNESFRQKAAELGLSAEQVRVQYAIALLNEGTQRYGIDVSAALDRARLEQAGSEFQDDLIFRLAALQQADAQFGAQYGLSLAEFQHRTDEDALTRLTPEAP